MTTSTVSTLESATSDGLVPLFAAIGTGVLVMLGLALVFALAMRPRLPRELRG